MPTFSIRCTRYRTTDSDTPTSSAMDEKARRPSACSAATTRRSIGSSSGASEIDLDGGFGGFRKTGTLLLRISALVLRCIAISGVCVKAPGQVRHTLGRLREKHWDTHHRLR